MATENIEDRQASSLADSFIPPATVLLRTHDTQPREVGECHMGGFYPEPEDATANRDETVVVSR